MKRQKGITLIALVITIIVLLILAGVSISLVVGDNGILLNAITSKQKTEEAQIKEIQDMDIMADEINNYKNNEAGNEGNGNTLPEIGISAEECTWEQIKAISEAGKGDEYFNLGDTKTFTTTDNKTIVMEIVAFNADEKSDGTGTAGITWISKQKVAEHIMKSTATTDGGWKDSELRTWLQGEFYNTLPMEVQEVIVSVNKTYHIANGATLTCDENSVWIPSYREVYGYTINDTTCENSGPEYTPFFIRYKGTQYWLRSVYYASVDKFWFTGWAGATAEGGKLANESASVVIAFCT